MDAPRLPARFTRRRWMMAGWAVIPAALGLHLGSWGTEAADTWWLSGVWWTRAKPGPVALAGFGALAAFAVLLRCARKGCVRGWVGAPKRGAGDRPARLFDALPPRERVRRLRWLRNLFAAFLAFSVLNLWTTGFRLPGGGDKPVVFPPGAVVTTPFTAAGGAVGTATVTIAEGGLLYSSGVYANAAVTLPNGTTFALRRVTLNQWAKLAMHAGLFSLYLVLLGQYAREACRAAGDAETADGTDDAAGPA